MEGLELAFGGAEMRFLGNEWTNEDLAGLRVIVVPSGIGEFQWAWTKYCNTGERFAILGLDGAPRRLHQFCELHDAIDVFAYCGFEYSTIRSWQKNHGLYTWEVVKRSVSPGSLTMLACNPHLEAGLPLASWLPDLPTTYTYPLRTTREHVDEAERYLRQSPSDAFRIGISCASYRGAAAWKTWKAEQWTRFLKLVRAEVGGACELTLLGGAWDDLTAAIFDEDTDFRWTVNVRGIPPVGRTTFGGAVELLRRLDAYIGFSSGLGHVACHLCNTPTFMLWPDHEQPLSTAWVNPELLESGFYVPSPWREPEEVFRLTKPWLRRVLKGDYDG